MATFILNGEQATVDVDPTTPLLWVVRDHFLLTGSKFGCGAGLCGACTMLVDEISMRTCVLPVSAVEGRSVTTIEGLGDNHPVQQAWVDHSVPQCGYCQSGQIMSTVSLLKQNPNPSEDEVKSALSGNICRCGTYQYILAAALDAAGRMSDQFYDATQSETENSEEGAA